MVNNIFFQSTAAATTIVDILFMISLYMRSCYSVQTLFYHLLPIFLAQACRIFCELHLVHVDAMPEYANESDTHGYPRIHIVGY